MTLSATVQKLLNQDQDMKAVATDRDAVVKAWTADIEGVCQEFKTALANFVADGTAAITEQSITISEESLGDYDAKRLAITIVGRSLFLSPVARLTIGGTGRIDLYREDKPAEDRRIFLVRGSVDVSYHPKAWMIEDRSERKTELADKMAGFQSVIRGRRKYTYLSTETIQDAIDYLLNL